MKKTLIALATVAVTTGAMAQVTLSGSLGMGVTGTSFVTSSTASTRTMGVTDSSFTFAANEDLGGGMKVSVSQTIDASGAQGTGVTGDGTKIALTGGFGGVTFGQLCASGALGEAVVGGGANTFKHAVAGVAGTDCRSYQYGLFTLPTLVKGLGVAVRIQNLSAAGTVNFKDFSAADNGLQYRFDYATGALKTGFYARSTTSELHASYDFGVAAVKFGADTKVVSGDKRQEFAIVVPMGAAKVSLGYGKKGVIKGTEIGVTYALSKRTAIQANFGTFTPLTAQTGDQVKSSNRVKLVHSF